MIIPDVKIRKAGPADRDQLARLREALWPKTSVAEHTRELEPILAGNTPGAMPLVNFVAEAAGGKLAGFAEVDLRSHADGCNPTRPVGYLEGWFVAEEYRRSGVGRRLLEAAEEWARGHGCVEMASDTWIDNEVSQQCHAALGFEVVDRCVNFRKTL
jgi:aminoglycoside 6'-N-acetyltransferase I